MAGDRIIQQGTVVGLSALSALFFTLYHAQIKKNEDEGKRNKVGKSAVSATRAVRRKDTKNRQKVDILS